MSDLLERLRAALADRYAIESEIGRGGMAVVFLAEDLKHHRKVALKVLHPELTATLGAERFLSEIEIVASLQHPHILPLYDSGEADELLYYVMPYAEGESLRQRLDREKQLAVDESVRIAVEVADGLDYAHQKGVVHRDIKPGNILLSARHAVIADFGIARAIEAALAERVTRTGLGVGTPLYASPEQATAEETLDGRTDIYSLGCMLYEMLAGEPPLTGATPQMTQARRMSETPTQLHTLRDTVPPALDHVIARALAKIPADRYATASQFGQALQAVLFAATPAHADLSTTPGLMATTPTAVGPEPSGKSLRWWLLAIPFVAIGLAAMLWPSIGWLGGGPIEITTSNLVHVTNESGVEFQPSISPDGAEVAYVEGPIGEPRIVVRSASEVGTGESRPAAAEGGKHWRPHWTPDGVSLRFWSCEGRWYVRPGCEWKETGSRGGSVRKVSVPRPGHYAWSRDGTRVAFADGDSIFAYSSDNPEPELLGVHTVDTWLPHSLVWSPDGQWLAYVNSNPHWRTSANVSHSSIWILSTAAGDPIAVTGEEHLNASPQWLPDSRHLLFVSDRDGSRGIHVVEVGPEGARGPPRSILPSSDAHSISISADGRKLAYAKFTVRQNIWSIRWPPSRPISLRADLGDAVPVTTGNQVIEGFSLSPDGQWIAFDSSVRGEFDIYKQRLAGGDPQLVVDMTGNAFEPKWSPDGTELAFHGPLSSEGGGGGEVFVVSADGGVPVQLTSFPRQDSHPSWSPDGLSIAFVSDQDTLWNSWVVSRTGTGMAWTDPVRLTDFDCLGPAWHPEGAVLVCRTTERSDFGTGWALVSPSGEVLAHLARPAGIASAYASRFSRDGSQIYFRGTDEDGAEGLWSMPASGGDAILLVALDDPTLTVFGTEVGPEEFYVAFAEYESDIWVMDLEW
jgi:serine/threonine-protein kinase